jgi:two-component system, OmpR family, KDP operon response regulator KdpE
VSRPEPLVLIVEDEPPMRRFLRAALRSHGYRWLEAATAAEATMLAVSHNPDLVLLDLGLPDLDGIELTKQLREWSQRPILVLSARGREDDKVLALDVGADDYLTKPFGVNELLARIRVALRHSQHVSGDATASVFAIGSVVIDLLRREVTKPGVEIHLTPTEYKLLVLLARNAGKVLTHRQILKDVWGPHAIEQIHYVRVHMAQLRKKIEDDPSRPKLLVTEPGVGYRLKDDPLR